MIKVVGDTVTPVSHAEVEAMFRRLRAAFEEINGVENCVEKARAALVVFGRHFPEVLKTANKVV